MFTYICLTVLTSRSDTSSGLTCYFKVIWSLFRLFCSEPIQLGTHAFFFPSFCGQGEPSAINRKTHSHTHTWRLLDGHGNADTHTHTHTHWAVARQPRPSDMLLTEIISTVPPGCLSLPPRVWQSLLWARTRPRPGSTWSDTEDEENEFGDGRGPHKNGGGGPFFFADRKGVM